MALRRFIILYHLIINAPGNTYDFAGEITALITSFFIMIGIALIKPLFMSIQNTKEALERSEYRYRTIFEKSMDGILVTRHDGRIVEANPSAATLFGFKQKEIIHQDVKERYAGARGRENFQRIMDAFGRVQNLEILMRKKNGKEITCLLGATFMNSEDGGEPHYLSIIRDISKRKEAEGTLAEERELLSVTLKSIADGVMAVDISGNIILMNSAAEALTGWSQSEALSRPFIEVFRIIDEANGREAENPLEMILNKKNSLCPADNIALVSKNGTTRPIAESGAPILDAVDKLRGAVIVFRDTTLQRRAEQELIRAQKLDSLGVLAGGIAHDLNNILAAIIGGIAAVKTIDGTRPRINGKLSEVEKACFRAKSLGQQLLTFAKGGAPVMKPGLVGGLVEESARFALTGAEVRLEIRKDPGLMPVLIDEDQFSQVIHNLVINACQAMDNCGFIKISLSNYINMDQNPWPPGEYVRISVEDNGCGISPEDQQKIFDPYFTTKKNGSGLGLSTAYSIIKKHHGFTRLASGLGSGTKIEIFLPVCPDNDSVTEDSKDISFVPGQGKILLMDDEPTIREMTRDVLLHLGYEVETAKDGKEAVEVYERYLKSGQSFSAAILDLVMPGGMDGKAVVQRLRQLDPNLKAIVSSGYSNDPVMANYLKFGFNAVIPKPYKIEELSWVLHNLINENNDSPRRNVAACGNQKSP